MNRFLVFVLTCIATVLPASVLLAQEGGEAPLPTQPNETLERLERVAQGVSTLTTWTSANYQQTTNIVPEIKEAILRAKQSITEQGDAQSQSIVTIEHSVSVATNQLGLLCESVDRLTNSPTETSNYSRKNGDQRPTDKSGAPVWMDVGLSTVSIILLVVVLLRIPGKGAIRSIVEKIEGQSGEIKDGLSGVSKPVQDDLVALKSELDRKHRELQQIMGDLQKKGASQINAMGEQAKKNEAFWAVVKASIDGKVDEGQKTLSAIAGKLQVTARELADRTASVAKREAEADRKSAEANRVLADMDARVQTAVREAQSKVRDEMQRQSAARDNELATLKSKWIAESSSKELGLKEELQSVAKSLAQANLELGTFKERVARDARDHQAALAEKDRMAGERISALQGQLADAEKSFEIRLDDERLRIKEAVAAEHQKRLDSLVAEAEAARKRCADIESRRAAETDELRRKLEATTAEKAKVEAEGRSVLAAAVSEKARAERILEEQKEATTKALAEGETLRSRLFPAEFSANEAFASLRGQLEDWESRSLPGAEIARAGLTLFANRSQLEPEIWRAALRDISLGVAKALAAEKRPSADIAAELIRWAKFLAPFSSSTARFQLKVPEIGAQIDTSWMNSKSRSVTVRNVLSWAVYGDMRIAYQAKVE